MWDRDKTAFENFALKYFSFPKSYPLLLNKKLKVAGFREENTDQEMEH